MSDIELKIGDKVRILSPAREGYILKGFHWKKPNNITYEEPHLWAYDRMPDLVGKESVIISTAKLDHDGHRDYSDNEFRLEDYPDFYISNTSLEKIL